MQTASARRAPESDADSAGIVLIVEDDVQTRSLIAQFLRDHGYAVIEAVDAGEAILVLKSRPAIDIVFADIRLPGAMDGRMLAVWIDQHRTGMPVLLTSGAGQAYDLGGRAFIAKPYIYATVAARLRELIDRLKLH